MIFPDNHALLPKAYDKTESAHVEDAVFVDDLCVVTAAETRFEISRSGAHPVRRRLDRIFFKLGPDLLRKRRSDDDDLIQQPSRRSQNRMLLNLTPHQ